MFCRWTPERFELQVADAVRYVHAQKMVHRDLWPNDNELSKDI